MVKNEQTLEALSSKYFDVRAQLNQIKDNKAIGQCLDSVPNASTQNNDMETPNVSSTKRVIELRKRWG